MNSTRSLWSVPADQKWLSYVKAFESDRILQTYILTYRQTEATENIYHIALQVANKNDYHLPAVIYVGLLYVIDG